MKVLRAVFLLLLLFCAGTAGTGVGLANIRERLQLLCCGCPLSALLLCLAIRT